MTRSGLTSGFLHGAAILMATCAVAVFLAAHVQPADSPPARIEARPAPPATDARPAVLPAPPGDASPSRAGGASAAPMAEAAPDSGGNRPAADPPAEAAALAAPAMPDGPRASDAPASLSASTAPEPLLLVRIGGECISLTEEEGLDPACFPLIEASLPAIRRSHGQVLVQGHTDSRTIDPRGQTNFRNNQELSVYRARIVAARLADMGVPTDRILVSGLGESRPIAPNDGERQRALNRRVDIMLAQ